MLSVLLVACVVLLVALVAAQPSISRSTRPPRRTSVRNKLDLSRDDVPPTEREAHELASKRIEIPDPEEEVRKKYAEVERHIHEAWAKGETLEPHDLDPNNPAWADREVLGRDPYMRKPSSAPDPPHGLDEEPKAFKRAEETNFTYPVVDINALKKRSLFEALHDDAHATYYVLYGYRKEGCETCAQHLAQFVDVCGNALEAERGKPKHLRRFHCGYWDVATSTPKDRRMLHRLNPHFNWHVPWAVVIELTAAHGGGEHADVLDIHYDKFPKDLTHQLRRVKADRDMHHIIGEHSLLATIFDSHNDGVSIVLFHDGNTQHLMAGKGRVMDYFKRVRDEERSHIHFAHIEMRHYGDGTTMHSPELDWLDEYNPTGSDVVAFIADADGKGFRTAAFNFSFCDGEWDNFKGILELREFVDEVKGYRHAHSGRRFRGIRKVRHYEVLDNEGASDGEDDGGPAIAETSVSAEGTKGSSSSSTSSATRSASIGAGGRSCARRVEVGDRIIINIVGTSLDHDKAFVNLTEHEVVAGAVPQLPPAAQHVFEGMCPGVKKDVYIPPHHGFHAEHFLVQFVRYVDDALNERAAGKHSSAHRHQSQPYPFSEEERAELERLARQDASASRSTPLGDEEAVAETVRIVHEDGEL